MAALCSSPAAAVALLGAADMQTLGSTAASNAVNLAMPASSKRRSSVARIVAAVSFSTVSCPRMRFDGRRAIIVSKAAGAQVSEEEPSATTEEEEQEVEEASEEAVAESGGGNSSVEGLLSDLRSAYESGDDAAITAAEAEVRGLDAACADLARQVATLSADVASGKDRYLRLNADFDNFRKRSEREKQQLATTVRGEVVTALLPMIDNFERAKEAIKTETDGERRIDGSYQSIYKQMVEVMKGLGVAAVDTVGKEFDPNVHEAIMREDSSEYAEGTVAAEFRKGFVIGDRLLRPAMVKVSSGPGPAGGAQTSSSEDGAVSAGEDSGAVSE